MLSIWLSLVFTLILQEFASVGAALGAAQQNHLNVWLIGLIWLVGTIFDIIVGFLIAKRVKERASPAWIERSERWSKTLNNHVGKYGQNVALFLFAVIDYPWLNAFAAGWLDLPFKNIFVFTLIGNLIWFALEWASVLGITTFAPHFNYWLLIAIGAVVLAVVVVGFLRSEQKK